MNSLQDQVIDRENTIAGMERIIKDSNDKIVHLNNVNWRLESQVKDLLNPPSPIYPKPIVYRGSSKARVYWKVGV